MPSIRTDQTLMHTIQDTRKAQQQDGYAPLTPHDFLQMTKEFLQRCQQAGMPSPADRLPLSAVARRAACGT